MSTVNDRQWDVNWNVNDLFIYAETLTENYTINYTENCPPLIIANGTLIETLMEILSIQKH